jgi:hypothetical protein
MKKNLLKLSLFIIIGLAAMPLKLLAQTGTADGTYNFSGTFGAINSGGTGFRTLGDKLIVSNATDVAGTQLYSTNSTLGGTVTTVIKAEGGTVCKKFTLKTMSISAYGSTRTLAAFTITVKDQAGTQLGSHSLVGTYALTTAITPLQTFLPGWPTNGYNNVSEISITAQYSGSAQTDLNFETLALANISAASVLPLTLVAFTGKESADGVALQWTTANEVNTAGFDIERSVNGGSFATLGSVPSQTVSNYRYTDNSVAGGSIYLYRLKMRDKDGRYTYSAIISITYSAKIATGYSVFPNPATGSYLYVKPATGNNANIQIAVVDMTGRTWYTGKRTAGSMSNGRFDIPVTKLPVGPYVLTISDSNGQLLQTTKFTVADHN